MRTTRHLYAARGVDLISPQAETVARDPENFRAVLTTTVVSAVEIIEIRLSAYTAHRSRALTRSVPSDLVSLIVVAAGGIRTRQDGRTAFSPAGTAAILRTNARYTYAASEGSRVWVVSIPRSKLGLVERQAIPGATATTFDRPVLFGSVTAFVTTHLATETGDDGNQAALETVLTTVVSRLVVEPHPRETQTASLAAQLRTEASRLISEQIANPELNAASLALDLGVSTRSLQRLFAHGNTTVSDDIRTARLEALALRLRTGGGQFSLEHAVKSVGFRSRDVGGRAFRDHFGYSLTEYVQVHAAADGLG